MTGADLDPEGPARRELYALTLDDRIADVCPGCGQHILVSAVDRLAWIASRTLIRCSGCGIQKGIVPTVAPAPPAPALYPGCGSEMPFSELVKRLGGSVTMQDVAGWGSEKRAKAAGGT